MATKNKSIRWTVKITDNRDREELLGSPVLVYLGPSEVDALEVAKRYFGRDVGIKVALEAEIIEED